MPNNNDQVALWAKTKMFGNWAPEDQEWGLQEFLKDMGWTPDDLAKAVQNGRFQEHAGNWFNTKGYAKTRARNEQRDGTSPEQVAKAAADAEATKRTEAEGRTAKINADIDAFYQELSKPLDPNDPEVARVAALAGRNAAGQAYGAGVEGGLSVQNTQATAANAAAQTFAAERARRQGLQANLAGLRSNTGLSQQDYLDKQRAFRTQQAQYAEGLNYENQMSQYQNRAAPWQMAGGALGGLGGGLAAGFASSWDPKAVAAGFQGGAGMGAGLLGQLGGGAIPQRKYTGGW